MGIFGACSRTRRTRSTMVALVYATHSMASTTPVAATGPAMTSPSAGVWPMLAISMPGWPSSAGNSFSTHCSQGKSAHFSVLNRVARRLDERGTTMCGVGLIAASSRSVLVTTPPAPAR